MANKPKQDKNENLKKYQERLKSLSKQDLTPPDHDLTLDELSALGAELLSKEGKTPTENPQATPKVENKVSPNNPYLQARNQILSKCPDWKKGELLKMERENNKNNRVYEEFVEEIRYLGDQLSR